MADRIPSDHESISTVRARIARHGGTRRRLEIPREKVDLFPEPDTVIRIVVNGTTSFAVIVAGHRPGDRHITGIYATPDSARNPAGSTDLLDRWLADTDRGPGRSVALDVIEPSFAYGLRTPGERIVYRSFEPPASSLADIAKSLNTDKK